VSELKCWITETIR